MRRNGGSFGPKRGPRGVKGLKPSGRGDNSARSSGGGGGGGGSSGNSKRSGAIHNQARRLRNADAQRILVMESPEVTAGRSRSRMGGGGVANASSNNLFSQFLCSMAAASSSSSSAQLAASD